MERLETGRRVPLPRATTESLGVPPRAILDFLDDIDARGIELHSFMLARNGAVAAEGWWSPYREHLPHQLFSLSKSFTSTAIGFAESEGLLALDDKVVDWFPDDLPASVSPNLAAMRIRHLLAMGTGHAADTAEAMGLHPEGDWVRAFLEAPVEREPGTHFVYNSGATYMLSAILRKATGMPLLDFLNDRLLAPLGIDRATWETCPRGVAIGGWGLSLKTEDIVKFGLLYLQGREWEGRRILPAGWAEEATANRIASGDRADNDWHQGYGYQFWRCRHGAFRGDGAFGQFCIVMPEQNAVVAMTAAMRDMQGAMNAVWDRLLPAMEGDGPAPKDDAASEALAARLRGLSIEPPRAARGSSAERLLDGREFDLEWNIFGLKRVRFDFAADEVQLTVDNPFGIASIKLGRGQWKASEARLFVNPVTPHNIGMQRIEASLTWRDETTLEATLRPVETPFAFTAVCRLEGERALTLEMKPNVWLVPLPLESAIRGTASAEPEPERG